MHLSEVTKIVSDETRLVADGFFESCALLGRHSDKEKTRIAFVLKKEYVEVVVNDGIDCIICGEKVLDAIPVGYEGGVLVSKDPRMSFFEIHNHLTREKRQKMVRKPSFVDSTAVIEEGAIVSSHGVHIGKNVVIGSCAVIKENVTIGDGSVIMDGTIVGTPAFYHFGEGDRRQLAISAGGVKIGRNVHIHTNVAVEAGVLGGDTYIGDNTAIDHCLVIGHDAQIGKNCTIVSCSLIAGWVHIGDNSFVAAGVDIAPAVKIGRNSMLSIGAVITKDVPDETQVTGNFAIEHKKFLELFKKQISTVETEGE